MEVEAGPVAIEVLAASRGRPHRLAEMMASAVSTAAHPGAIEMRIRVDEDDPEAPRYPKFAVRGRRAPVPRLMAELVKDCEAEIRMQASDDVLFRTRGWDERVRAVARQYPDGLWVASPRAGDHRQKCQHFFTTQRWDRLVGTEGWQELEHFGIDQWQEDIAKAVGRMVWLDDVLVEHMHVKHKKAPQDETYLSKRREDLSGRNMKRYYGDLRAVRDEQTQRVRRALGGAV